MHLLQSYSWPGNVRELSNFAQRLSVLYPSKKIELSGISNDFLPKELIALADQLESLRVESDPNDVEISGSVETHTTERQVNTVSDQNLQQTTDFNQDSNEINDLEKIIELSDSMENLPEEGIQTRDIINDLEANLIRTALSQSRGNVSKAAELLKMGRTSVIQKISKYSLKTE